MSDALLADITGVILVGGKSRRMGQDKAFLELDGQPLVERLLSVFNDCFPQTLLAGDNDERFSGYDVPVVSDIYPGSPLGGIYSGLCRAATGYIFVASCDLIFPNSAVIRRICSLKDDYDAVVPLLPHGFETLCTLYSKNCLPAMQAMLESGNHRIFDLYPQISTRTVPYEQLADLDQDDSAFLGVNTPEEFEHAKNRKSGCPICSSTLLPMDPKGLKEKVAEGRMREISDKSTSSLTLSFRPQRVHREREQFMQKDLLK